MAWWKKIFKRRSRLDGLEFRIAFVLYSTDGKRQVEVREFSNGETYVVERELVEGTTFKNRHAAEIVGPFASPEDADKFIVATSWFNS
jgi:hypothetical protein